jgi:1-acyl-sn-glycerol-3-phosphate acyltransferase
LRQAGQFLDEGLAVVVFPEGARSHGGQLRPAFPGAVLMAVRNGVPVLPVGLTGTEKLKGLGWVLHRPGITVNIGRPFHLPPASGRLTRVELDRQADFVMWRIAGLLPVEYQGDYKT